MRETPLSICERASVTASLAAGRRLDNRKFLEVRDISIHFGQDYGCCTAVVGQTRVLAQVSSEVVEPRPSRPNEGKLQINVHLSPMAAPHFEQGRGNELVDQLQQILDRNIKDSRCLDLESLCIMAEESVWQLRCDVTVLNAAGNLSDACNLAAVSALRHFHRPDVTVEEDGRVTIHTFAEMEPIPTYMKKIPVCLTFAFFMEEDTYYTLLDPTDIEERVQSGRLIIGLNPHGEITSLIFPGRVSLEKAQIMNCINIAFSKAKATAEMIQEVVEEDLEKRKKKKVIKTAGFTKGLVSDANYVKNKYDQMSDQVDKISLLVASIRNTAAKDDNEASAEVAMEDSDSEEDEPLATGHYPTEEVRKEKAKEVSSFLASIRKGTEGNDTENDKEGLKENMETLEDYDSDKSNKEEEDVKESSTAANVDSFLSAFRKASPSKVRDEDDESLESDSDEEKITEKLTSHDMG